MFYYLVKAAARIALRIFCRKIVCTGPNGLKAEGPLLLACTHPNSFFDAVLLGALFQKPVHFLARGDAFKKPLGRKLLAALKAIPIYRLREGREHLALNDATFEKCRQVLREGGIVLIFSEGLCLHQWQLRPLKKGTARIALDAFADPRLTDNFRVLPVSFNYHSFQHFGKRIRLHFGTPLTAHDISVTHTEALQIQQFNTLLSNRLEKGLLRTRQAEATVQFLLSNYPYRDFASLQASQAALEESSTAGILQKLTHSKLVTLTGSGAVWNGFIALLLLIPALAGWLFQAPLYLPIRRLVRKKTENTVFYDSVLFGTLLVTYPLYWMIANGLSLFFLSSVWLHTGVALLPVWGVIYLIWRDCLQRVRHFFSLSATIRKQLRKYVGGQRLT